MNQWWLKSRLREPILIIMRTINYNGREYTFAFTRRCYGNSQFYTWVDCVTDVESGQRYLGYADPYPAINPPKSYLEAVIGKYLNR